MKETKGGILMPSLPKRPVIKNKIIISEATCYDFEKKLDDFLEGLDSYSIQYKPVCGNNQIIYTALVTYHKPEKSDNSAPTGLDDE